jgi:protein-disulfide isomerase
MALYQEIMPEFKRHNAQLLGISVDGVWCHLAFAKDRKIRFPLLADFEPKGQVSRSYNAYRESDGFSERALFVLVPEGSVYWSYLSPVGVNPGADGILRARRHGQREGELMNMTEWKAMLVMPVSPTRDHIRGQMDAPVTLVEYGDYECPYCGAAHGIVNAILVRMGDQLCFVYRHFPLTTMHPHAQLAAEAAAQGEFWAMHDLLFDNQQQLDAPYLLAYAKALGLDTGRFSTELAEHLHAPKVREDCMSGVRSGVNGTPTFYINGVRHDGSWDAGALMAALQRAAGAL